MVRPTVRVVSLLGSGVLAFLCSTPGQAQRFFPDDPLIEEPSPLDTPDPNAQALSSLLDFFSGAFGRPGERHPENGVITAQGVNTLGEPMDGAWYVARHSRSRMSADELRGGAGDANPPAMDGPWRVLTVKSQGFRTGILIEDANDRQYLLRFDPIDYPELVTGASIIASKFLYALGYWTAEDYIVRFDRDQLVAAVEGTDVTSVGRLRNLLEEDIDRFLRRVPQDPERRYRALATRVPDGMPLGPFKFEGRRSDDPNDLFSHEHRRDLRGLYVFSAWLNNVMPEATSTLDMLVVEETGEKPVRFIRHMFVDFGASLGSYTDRVKEIQHGNAPIFSWKDLRYNALSFGVVAPEWMKADFPDLPAVGRFECRTFDPERWSPRYLAAPLANRLPDDDFWAAKTLMTLSDEDIRTVVATAEYSNPDAEVWVAACLIERRDRIGRTYFGKVLPLDDFRVEQGRLVFEDLAVRYGFVEPRAFRIQWSRFDNLQNQAFALPGVGGDTIPETILDATDGEYFVADITLERTEVVEVNGVGETQRLEVYLRRDPDGLRIAGIDHLWPGKVVVEPRAPDPVNSDSQHSEPTDR